MSEQTVVIFESNDQLRAFLSLGVGIPAMRIWALLTKEQYEGLAPEGVGNAVKPIKDQFYGVEGVNGFYVLIGRDGIGISGKPTGNFKPLPKEQQDAWITFATADKCYLAPELPTPSMEEVTPTQQ